jgi:hypothetical protein
MFTPREGRVVEFPRMVCSDIKIAHLLQTSVPEEELHNQIFSALRETPFRMSVLEEHVERFLR